MNKTKLAVAAFVVLLVIAGYAASSRADTLTIGLGKSFVNSSSTVGEIGYERKGWELQAAVMGAGYTKNGRQDNLSVYSLSYITEPGWGYKGVQPYVRLGVSHNTGSKIIGSSNFRLGLGVNFNHVFRLEYVHHSSAGIHDPNTGLDYVALSYIMPAPW